MSVRPCVRCDLFFFLCACEIIMFLHLFFKKKNKNIFLYLPDLMPPVSYQNIKKTQLIILFCDKTGCGTEAFGSCIYDCAARSCCSIWSCWEPTSSLSAFSSYMCSTVNVLKTRKGYFTVTVLFMSSYSLSPWHEILCNSLVQWWCSMMCLFSLQHPSYSIHTIHSMVKVD